jgi:hypothetical protein
METKFSPIEKALLGDADLVPSSRQIFSANEPFEFAGEYLDVLDHVRSFQHPTQIFINFRVEYSQRVFSLLSPARAVGGPLILMSGRARAGQRVVRTSVGIVLPAAV